MTDPQTEKRIIRKTTLWATVLNFLLAVMKILTGIFGHSTALISDAVNSIGDVATAIAAMIAALHGALDAHRGHVALRGVLLDAALKLTRDLGCSSFHLLFPTEVDHAALKHTPLLHRSGFQFHWQNAGYGSFDDFLAAMTHDKRKKIRQERKKLASSGVTFRWVEGAASTDADWDHFLRCYADTYARHHSDPHLNRAFFAVLRETMPDNLLLIIADRHGEPVACSFCIKDRQRLYGRHWGTLEYLPGLHFETCYQQGIEYAIAKGLQVFEGGAQGEHKLARGLVPTATHSWHWLENAEFRNAVDHFLERESDAISHYMNELDGPFRREPAPAGGTAD